MTDVAGCNQHIQICQEYSPMSTDLARLPDTAAVAKNCTTQGIATLFIGGQMFGISEVVRQIRTAC